MESNSGHISLAGLEPGILAEMLGQRGIDPHYAGRLLYWVYNRGLQSFNEINDIPKATISLVETIFETGLYKPESSCTSSDGTIKYLFRNREGLSFETVYLPETKRSTVCISVQSGCRMGCRFCATGMNGWRGNLTAGEIVNQVISIPYKVTHVVLMGMGEPGDNIEEVIKACRILLSEWGLAKGRTRVTVSTVGVLPSLVRLLNETECNITLSLHSPFHGERREVIPAEKNWPFADALEVMNSYRARSDRRFTVAYVMIKGINDTERHLHGLKDILSGSRIRINLLPYHPFEGDANVSSDTATLMSFKHALVTSGIEASVRRSRGSDIAAACGMLAAESRE